MHQIDYEINTQFQLMCLRPKIHNITYLRTVLDLKYDIFMSYLWITTKANQGDLGAGIINGFSLRLGQYYLMNLRFKRRLQDSILIRNIKELWFTDVISI